MSDQDLSINKKQLVRAVALVALIGLLYGGYKVWGAWHLIPWEQLTIQQIGASIINFFVVFFRGFTLKFVWKRFLKLFIRLVRIWAIGMILAWLIPLDQWLKYQQARVTGWKQSAFDVLQHYNQQKRAMPEWQQFVIWLCLTVFIAWLLYQTILGLVWLVFIQPPAFLVRLLGNLGQRLWQFTLSMVRITGIGHVFNWLGKVGLSAFKWLEKLDWSLPNTRWHARSRFVRQRVRRHGHQYWQTSPKPETYPSGNGDSKDPKTPGK